MKAVLAALLLLTSVACSRQVQVETTPAPASAIVLHVTNNAPQAVNVYVVTGGNDIFVGNVPPNTTQALSVTGVAEGSTVRLEAREVSGSPPHVYSRDTVVLQASTNWTVP